MFVVRQVLHCDLYRGVAELLQQCDMSILGDDSVWCGLLMSCPTDAWILNLWSSNSCANSVTYHQLQAMSGVWTVSIIHGHFNRGVA